VNRSSGFDTANPLRKASGRNHPRLLLVNGELKPVCGGTLPATPPSFKGARGQYADLPSPRGRVIAVGCGKFADHGSEEQFWEAAGAAAIDALRAFKLNTAALCGELLPVSVERARAAAQFAAGATVANYRCTAFRSVRPKDQWEIESLQLHARDWPGSAAGRALGDAINWARALVEAPANILTPQAFAAEAQALEASGVKVQVLDLRALERLGAGGLVAVGRSSEHPPCLLVCQWQGRASKQVDLGLVGKGLTFDAGGLNLKAAPGIQKMKLDMGGAAAVVGALRVLAQRKAALNVVAAIPLCENVIDGKAYRPGDVIRSLSGLTIEVDNTDAEGRIVLADALTYLIRTHKPGVLVDIATLTGGIMAALHEEFAGLFTADEELAALLHGSAESTREHLWRMPLSKRQDYLVDSEIADVKNVAAPGLFGVGMGSAIGGAKFLERFAAGSRWAHLDIAGVAWATRPQTGIAKGPTGFGVRLLDAFAARLAEARE
jgi:leucyl aminopeptidase